MIALAQNWQAGTHSTWLGTTKARKGGAGLRAFLSR